MSVTQKRNLFLGLIGILLAILIVVSIVVISKGPRTSPVEVVSSADGTKVVNDLNDGEMTIPDYNIPTSTYKSDEFKESNGVISYEGGSHLGINVSSSHGEIDWAQVAESGVEFAMIRVGYRTYKGGAITKDPNFDTNLAGAQAAGLDVGVYFFSQAITDTEADEEATFVLEQIQAVQIQYPIAFYWDYVLDSEGEIDVTTRTSSCTGSQITGFAEAFCNKISRTGRVASFYATKSMAYEKLDLSKLSGYDLWYAEYKKAPSFFYDFKMWQYTSEGTVPGITQKVPISLALKSYSS